MAEPDDALTLVRVARIIRRFWLFIVILTVLGAGAAYAISKAETPLYSADSSVYFSLRQSASNTDLNQGAAYTQAQMLSFAQLATSHITLQRVIDGLGLNTTSTRLARDITVTTPQNTVILDISVSATSAQSAASIANSVASNLANVVVELAPTEDSAAGKSTPTVSAKVINPAVPPKTQSSPNKSRDAAIGGLLGLLVAVVGSILFTRLDTRVRSIEAVARVTDTPVLGQIGRLAPNLDARPVMLRAPNSEEAEYFRRARAGLRFASIDKDVRVILITSGIPGEGKTTFSVNLALAMVETNARVLLMDADFRRPRVANALGVEGAIGLTTVLIDGVTLAEARRPYGTTSLDLLLAGDVPPNPSELLSSARLAQVLAELATEYDVIIVDSAPVLSVADATFLAPHVDLTLLMVDASKSRNAQLAKSIRSLEVAGAHISGIVLNRLKVSKRRDDYYYGETLRPEPWRSRLRKRFQSQSERVTATEPETVEPEAVGPELVDSGLDRPTPLETELDETTAVEPEELETAAEETETEATEETETEATKEHENEDSPFVVNEEVVPESASRKPLPEKKAGALRTSPMPKPASTRSRKAAVKQWDSAQQQQ